jgi:hypothetical protein
MKTSLIKIVGFLSLLLLLASCEKYDNINPNVAGEEDIVPPQYTLGRLCYELYVGGGVTDNMANSFSETPFSETTMRWNQFTVSNDIYYAGLNSYFWSNTAPNSSLLRNVLLLERNANINYGIVPNPYTPLVKFFKAYTYIWYSQRVGDIPMTEAGQGLDNLTPKFDSQHDVYKRSLELLDSANMDIQTVTNNPILSGLNIAGDIYYGNSLAKWRKLINTYTLRVLISLSKKADAADAADLNIKGRFNNIINNPTTYPLLASNSDNLIFAFNTTYNKYPLGSASFYNDRTNISVALLNLLTDISPTTGTQDPRLFVFATPAPAELTAGKKVNDFTAYKGADLNLGTTQLTTNSKAGKYSYINYIRYYNPANTGPTNPTGVAAIDALGDETKGYNIIGYSEMCFNIAEGINRGWTSGGTYGDAAKNYTNGIKASMLMYNIADSTNLTISDVSNKKLGTVKVGKNIQGMTSFYAQPAIAYKGNNVDGLAQILTQKYIAFWQNSGFEAFYNWRRTGFPKTFISSGAGVNAAGIIPRRFQYPTAEAAYNAENYNKSIQGQFGGSDDLNKDLWINQ